MTCQLCHTDEARGYVRMPAAQYTDSAVQIVDVESARVRLCDGCVNSVALAMWEKQDFEEHERKIDADRESD